MDWFRRFWYRRFRLAAGLAHRLHRRLTPAGRLVLGVLGAAGVVGFDTNRTVTYQVFALLLALLVVAAVGTARVPSRLVVRRSLPRYATAGEPVTYRLHLENPGDRPARGLTAFEEVTDPRPTLAEFLASREPGEERRSRLDRAVGYWRWRWLVQRNLGAAIAPVPLPDVAPGGATEAAVTITPGRRGSLRFTGVTLGRPDPFGLVRALAFRPLPHSLLVLPRRYPVPRVTMPGSRRYQPGGVALAGSVGDSEEFVSLRDYRPGDPLRRVHWKSWARVGRPVVREHQDEFFVRYALVLDTFASSPDDEVFETAVSVAASLACVVETQEALLDLMFVGPETYVFTAGRGLGSTARLLEVLAGVQPCRDRPFRVLRNAVLTRQPALSGCLAVLLGWDDDRRDLVRHLAAHGTPTRALVVIAAGATLVASPAEGAPAPIPVEVGRAPEGLARL